MKNKTILLLSCITFLAVVLCLVSYNVYSEQPNGKDLARLHEGNIQGLESADKELKVGYGFKFRGIPIAVAIPPGQPDFTVWPVVEYRHVTPEVTVLKLAKPGEGCYRLVVCEWEPTVLALHHSCGDKDYYWVYKDKIPVEVTKEVFKEKLTGSQYLCPERNPKPKGREI